MNANENENAEPTPGRTTPTGQQNIERLLHAAYRPESPDADFVRRVAARMQAAANEAAAALPSPAERTGGAPAGPVLHPRRRLRFVHAAIAAMLLIGTGLVGYSMVNLLVRSGAERETPLNSAERQAARDGHTYSIDGTGSNDMFATSNDLPNALLSARPLPPAPPVARVAAGQEIVTATGQRRRVELPDGSVLFVNEQSRLTVTGARAVRLAAGEVFAEVAPRDAADPAGKFVITTPQRTVTALGTKFAVTVTPAGTGVAVTQGKVQVSGMAALIDAGRQLLPSPDTPALVGIPRASHLLDWTRDLIAAAESPLVPASDKAGGALVAVDPKGQEFKLSLRKFHVDVFIEDGFARTTIDQTYFNHTSWRMEGTFYFPLPADASLSRLAMYVNGLLNEGGMVERDYGRSVYEQIVRKMQDPALLEWIDGTTFKMRVFPLDARQEKRIILSYTQKLESLYGQAKYRFPGGHNLGAVDHWSFHAEVRGAANWRWRCESHLLVPGQRDDDLLLDCKLDNYKLEKDVALELNDPAGGAATDAARFNSASHETGNFLMLRYRPVLEGPPASPRRDWVFLVETSADRDPLLARTQIEVVRTILRNAQHDDRFAIVLVGTRTQVFDKALRPVTPDAAGDAIKWLEKSHLVGALDLEAGLAAAADFCRSADTKNAHIVHLGSGVAVLGRRQANELAKILPAGAAYVGVGVGKRWDRSFMKLAAARSGGYVTQINPDEQVSWRAFDLLATLNTPRLLDLKVVDNDEKVTFLCTADSVAAGEEITAIGRMDGSQARPKTLTITATLNGKPYRRVVTVENVGEHADYLPRQWARMEIDRLVADGAEKNKPRIVELSKAMYVMSPFTSLLVLENEQMYQQFKVDRGRKDHWAMYPAPDKIEVVTEPLNEPRTEVRGQVGTNVSATQPDAVAKAKADAEAFIKQLAGVMPTIKVRTPYRMFTWPNEPYYPSGATVSAWEYCCYGMAHPRLTLVKLGSGMQTLTGFNTYTGATTISGGGLTLGIMGSVGTFNGIGNLTLKGSGVLDLNGGIEDIGAITLSGGGATILADPVDGLTYLGAGQVVVRSGAPLLHRIDPTGIKNLIWRPTGSQDTWTFGGSNSLSIYAGANANFFTDDDIGNWVDADRDGIADGHWLVSSRPYRVRPAWRFQEDGGMIQIYGGTGFVPGSYRIQSISGAMGPIMHSDQYRDWTYSYQVPRGGALPPGLVGPWATIGSDWASYDNDLTVDFASGANPDIAGHVTTVNRLHHSDPRELADMIRRLYERDEFVRQGQSQYPDGDVWRELTERRLAFRAGMPPDAPANLAVRERMQANVPEIRFSDITFENGLNFLRELQRINIHPNWGAMEAIGITKATPVSLQLRDVTFETALKELLAKAAGREDALDYMVRNGVIHVSSSEDIGRMTANSVVGPGHVVLFSARDVVDGVCYRMLAGQTNNNSYQRPAVTGDTRLFTDLIAYAPGFATTDADVATVLADKMPQRFAQHTGRIDPAARALIERARSAGWVTYRLPLPPPTTMPAEDESDAISVVDAIPSPAAKAAPTSSAKGEGYGGTITFDGAGRFVVEHTLASGLGERIVCDGKTLLHVYAELGLASTRPVNRFNRSMLAAAVPWFVPEADELAEGADVIRVDERTVAIVPHAVSATQPENSIEPQPTSSIQPENSAKPQAESYATPGTHEPSRPESERNTKPRSQLRILLTFGSDGRLVERKLVARKDGEEKTLWRVTYSADGTVAVFGQDGKLIAEQRFDIRPAAEPNLAPDLRQLVVLPMPSRLATQSADQVTAGMDKPDAADANAMRYLADNLRDFNALLPVAQKFWNRGDRRIGFYTLLLGTDNLDWPKASPLADALKGDPNSDSPLVKFATQWLASERGGRELLEKEPVADPSAGFVQRIAEFSRLYFRWANGRPNIKSEADRKAEVERLVNFAKATDKSPMSWAILSLASRHYCSGTVAAEMARALGEFAKTPGLAFLARYESARLYQWAGWDSFAQAGFKGLFEDALAAGVLMPTDGDFFNAFGATPAGRDMLTTMMRTAGGKLVQAHARPAVLDLAWRCNSAGATTQAEELLAAANADAAGVERLVTLLATMEFHWRAGQFDKADAAAEQLLAEESLADHPALWRTAAAISEKRGRLAEWTNRLEKTLDLAYGRLDDGPVDLRVVQAEFGGLLNCYGRLADAVAGLDTEPSRALVGRVARAADRWRRIAGNGDGPCQAAARVFETLGAREVAWEYLTTPLSARPNESGPWNSLAQSLAQQGEIDLADRAYAAAFGIEPTNAQLLWDRAEMLRTHNRGDVAKRVYRQIAEGNWQASFSSIQEQARKRAR